ncbi:MAG: flagellar basal body L-ring protein FlgH, partial [Bacteriovoracia bacterium]
MKHALAILLLTACGCSTMMGKLRRDLDDSPPYYEPTVGGKWPEGGMLTGSPMEVDRYNSVGHSERGPASVSSREYLPGEGPSWVSQGEADAVNRDRYREAISYSSRPDMAPPVKRRYKNGTRATRADFIDESQNEGSLWASNGQTNYFFTKNRTRAVGDIVTVTLDEQMVKDVHTEVKKSLSQMEMEIELADAQERLRKRALGIPEGDAKAGAPATAARGPAAAGKEDEKKKEEEPDVDVPKATYADVDVSKHVTLAAGETMMAEILERYPNGNYKIRSTKRVPYRGSTRLMTMVGIAKAADVD